MQVTDSRGFFARAAYGMAPAVPQALYRLAAFPAAMAYGAAIRLRRLMYRSGVYRTHSLGATTISVGNITAGGTGKTPMVAWLVQWLIAQGRHPAVLSRGYGARQSEKKPHENDEAAMLRETLPNVPHYAHPDRVQSARQATADGADCLVLDDGFQHIRARRDINIVMLDALDPFGGGWLLPMGTLREPLACLKEADAIVLTRTDLADEKALRSLRKKIPHLTPKAVVCETSHRPVRLVSVSDGTLEPPENLSGRRVGLFCGIGNPWGFVKTVQSLGANVVAACFLPDHFGYDDTHLATVAQRLIDAGAETVLTTAKDAVKIEKRWKFATPLKVIQTEIAFLSGLETLEATLKDAIEQ